MHTSLHHKPCKTNTSYFEQQIRRGETKFKRVIVITGTPGVGKTQVSRLLVSELDASHIDLAELAKKENLISGFDQARKTPIADTTKMANRVEELIEASKTDVIIDGHYAVDVVPAKKTYIVFVLRRNPNELKSVLEDYGFEGKKLWENLAAEILDVCLWDAVSVVGSAKVCEIDVSDRKIEKVVEEIVSVLNRKEKCKTGVVDWLGKLEEEGQLQDFLKYL